MRRLTLLACCLSTAALLSACGPDGGYDARGHYHADVNSGDETVIGYYDARGHYHIVKDQQPDGKNFYTDHSAVKGDPAGVIGYDRNTDPDVIADNVAIVYKDQGYYDRYGTYYTITSGPNIPHSYYPPHGMCRVWLVDRAPKYQPPVESCAGIQSRVPDDAYVVYGG